MRGFARTSAAVVLGTLMAAGQGTARAQNGVDLATAQSLFDDAKNLAVQGRWAEVCPKLEESQRLDPRPTTIYRLADCYEHVGKTASAWSCFLSAATIAKAEHEGAKESVALERARSLEPRLTRLEIVVPAFLEGPGLKVLRNGVPLGQAQWGVKIPVDPGEYTFRATAPGKKPFVTTLHVSGEGAVIKAILPSLLDEAPANPGSPSLDTPLVPPTPANEPPDSSLTTTGLVLGGLGLAAIGGGLALYLSGGRQNDCAGRCVAASGLILGGSVAFSLGTALVMVGLTSRSSKPAPATVALSPWDAFLQSRF